MSVQTNAKGFGTFGKINETANTKVQIRVVTIGFLVVGIITAGIGGYYIGMGKTVALAIISAGFGGLLRDAYRKQRIAAVALTFMALAYAGGLFIMTNTFGAQELVGEYAPAAYSVLLGAILFVLGTTWISGITESIQLFAFLFLFDGAFFGQFWITELIFGKWLPIATNFIVTVFHP
jgi:hypothetical protein